jgi:hypothetical protein
MQAYQLCWENIALNLNPAYTTMTTEQNLTEKIELIRKAALDSGSAIVAALLVLSDEQGGYRVTLGPNEFLSLLGQCRPRIVYLHSDMFDADEDLRFQLDVEGDDEDENELLSKNGKFKALVKKWVKKNGHVSAIASSFMLDSVLHVVWEQPTWIDEFEADAEDLESSMADERRLVREQRAKADRARFSDAAKELCNHPRFNAGRWSFEKREYLAKGLFPDLDDHAIRSIVEEATNMDWVKG